MKSLDNDGSETYSDPNHSNTDRQDDRSRFRLLWGVLILIIIIPFGQFFVELNVQLYKYDVPVYDALYYQIANGRLMQMVHTDGLWPSLSDALNSSNNSGFPMLLAPFLGLFFTPERYIGTWLQSGLLYLFLISLFCYYTSVFRMRIPLAFVMLLPFLAMAGLYQTRGGLSDFRLDLPQLFTYTTACLWYLIAIRSEKNRDWCFWGFFTGIASIIRPTSLVYFAVVFVPMMIVDLLRSKTKTKITKGFLFSGIVFLLTCGWFLFERWQAIYHYYMVWNVDSLCKLPLSQSCNHLKFLADHIGLPVAAAAAVWIAVLGISVYLSPDAWRQIAIRNVNLRLLYIGIVPVLFLVIKGAGLNTFVSVTSAYGVLLFAFLPFNLDFSQVRKTNKTCVMGCINFALIIYMMTVGFHKHCNNYGASMSTLKTMVMSVMEDAYQQQISNAVVLVYGSDISMCNDQIRNVVLYEFDGVFVAGYFFISVKNPIRNTRMTFGTDYARYDSYAPSLWANIPGDTDNKKLQFLVDVVNEHADYLVLPTMSTAQYLAEVEKHTLKKPVKNLPWLTQSILGQGDWVPVSGELRFRNNEVFVVYRNLGRSRSAGSR